MIPSRCSSLGQLGWFCSSGCDSFLQFQVPTFHSSVRVISTFTLSILFADLETKASCRQKARHRIDRKPQLAVSWGRSRDTRNIDFELGPGPDSALMPSQCFVCAPTGSLRVPHHLQHRIGDLLSVNRNLITVMETNRISISPNTRNPVVDG